MLNKIKDEFIIFWSALVLIIIMAIIIALPTMWLWNWLMPKIFWFNKNYIFASTRIIYIM